MLKLEKIDYIFISICAIFTILAVIFVFFPELGNILNLSAWQIPGLNFGEQLCIVFLVCLIGNILPFPTPYTFIIIPVANKFPELFILPALTASLGALLGEIVGYLIGRGTREALKKKNIEKLNKWELLVNQRPLLTMFLIFLFGLTPLNDDNVMVPIGLTGFDIKKTISSCWLGKLGMMLVFAMAGASIGSPQLAMVFIIIIILITIAIGVSIVIYLVLHAKKNNWETKKTVLLSVITGFIFIIIAVFLIISFIQFPTTTAGTGSWIEGWLILLITIIIIWFMLKLDVSRFLKEKYGVEELDNAK
ncbi:MAG: hypothetical protein EAX96_01745 [Candidatus Lokiarchaeota archaeon]|nr:hypothetical protein [Candidatus Lokiarchaeota archaeon]